MPTASERIRAARQSAELGRVTYWATHDSAGVFHVTDERDCLPPDAIGGIVRYEASSAEEALAAARRVEGNGTILTFQVGDIFYETPES